MKLVESLTHNFPAYDTSESIEAAYLEGKV